MNKTSESIDFSGFSEFTNVAFHVAKNVAEMSRQYVLYYVQSKLYQKTRGAAGGRRFFHAVKKGGVFLEYGGADPGYGSCAGCGRLSEGT